MRCAVLGDPIGHSLSPTLHRAAYAELGLDWTYDAIRVGSGDLPTYVAGLDEQWRGLSLTMPLKREAMALLTSQDEWVGATRAANTMVLEAGARHGLNTDVTGALSCLRHVGARPERGIVLGGGATATSVLMALAELGLASATVVVRDPSRAAETLAAVRRRPRPPELEVVTFDELGEVSRGADVVVSTIPTTAQTAVVVQALDEVPVVFEVVYDPWPSPLVAAAQRSGQVLISGLDLLVAQAGEQVRAMTGRPEVPIAAMRARSRARAGRAEPRMIHPVAAGVCAVLGLSGGALVPRLIARLPPVETDARPDDQPDDHTERDPDATELISIAAVAERPQLTGWAVLTCGVAAAILGAGLGADWSLVYLLPLVPVGAALAIIDWHTRILPSSLILPAYPLLVVAILVAWLAAGRPDGWSTLGRAVLGAVIVLASFYLLWWVQPRGLGFGDVRLSGLLGLMLGYLGWAELVVGVYAGFVLGGVVGGALTVTRAVDRKGFPFGPFLLAGALAGVVIGGPVVDLFTGR